HHLFDQFVQALSDGQPFACQAQDVRRDGSVLDVEAHGVPFHYQGRPHLLGIVRDITSRKQVENQLRLLNEQLEQRVEQRTRHLEQSQAHFASLVECLPIYVIRKDREGRITYANSLFLQLVGRPTEELIGKTDWDLFPPELARKYRADDQWVMQTGQTFEDIEENRSNGERRFFEVRKVPIHEPDGGIVGIQAIFWDVTERKLAQEE